ncbi:MAG: hypothetical protein U0228_25250 [Myxococcaceae bacterium]
MLLNSTTPPSANLYQFGRLRPIRGLRDVVGYTLTPLEVMVLASTWALTAERLRATFRVWSGPPERLDRARGKSVFSNYDIIDPRDAQSVLQQLAKRVKGTVPTSTVPFDWLLDSTADLVRVLSEAAIGDQGLLVLASA